MRNRISIDAIRLMLLEEKNLNANKKLAKALFNVINKDKLYVPHALITDFLEKDCGIFQSWKDIDSDDFHIKDFETVMEVICNFFKKAKGPKEIMEDDGEDASSNTLKRKKNKNEGRAVQSINLSSMKQSFEHDVNQIVLFDFRQASRDMRLLERKMELRDLKHKDLVEGDI